MGATTAATPNLSWFNRIGLVIMLVGVVYLFIAGETVFAVLMGVVLIYLVVSVVRSRRGTAPDSERVNAVQPLDERDARVVTHGFSAVGQFAFLAQLAIVMWLMGRPDSGSLELEGIKLLLLALVLGTANWLALRRG